MSASARAVAIIATPGFSPFHFSVPLMVFGKGMPEPDKFRVTVCAEQPGEVVSDMGISVSASHGLEHLDEADIIIVPFWPHPAQVPSPALLHALAGAWQRGAEVVGLCLGAYVLAYSGLLDGRRAATHWEYEPDFSRRFPAIHLDTNALYTSDQRLTTSAGTAAGIDCCVNIVRQHYGQSLANRVARRMVMPPYREGGQAQYIDRPVPVTTRDSQINQLIEYLQRNLDKPQDLDALARQVNMSRRTFTRHFTKATGLSAGEWLNSARLHHSQVLLETTDHSIEHIARLSGFLSPISFRQRFKAHFAVSPSEWRHTFRGPVRQSPGGLSPRDTSV